MGRTRFLSLRAVELLVVALVGAGLALGGAALFGKLGDHTTTTIEQVAPSPLPATATTQGSSKALTPEAIYRQDGPGVVQITATSVTQSAPDPFNFFPTTPQTSKSLGSGFVLDRAGLIITNFHVIQGAQKAAQDNIIGKLLQPGAPITDAPLLVRMLDRFPLLRRLLRPTLSGA